MDRSADEGPAPDLHPTQAHYRDWDPLLPASALADGSLLLVAPHPDDEVIGAGGLILAHRDAGFPVDVLILTDGSLGEPGRLGDDDYRAQRKGEAEEAARRLGGTRLHFSTHRDGSLRGVARDPLLDELLVSRRPVRVALPSPCELHPDHRAAALLVADALARSPHVPGEILLYEVGVPTLANVLVDVTGLMDRKVHALAAHASQLAHHDLLAKVRHLNAMRTVNVADPAIRYAEAYTRLSPGRVIPWFRSVERLLRLSDGLGGESSFTESPPENR